MSPRGFPIDERGDTSRYLQFDEGYPLLEVERDIGANDWGLAFCPAHYDSNASLGFKEGEDGEMVVWCHTGCSIKEVIQALRLMLDD
jgi:hypothetical protein